VSSLTIIDSEVAGLSKLLDSIGPKKLKQLIVIFNKDLEYDIDPILSPDSSIINELFESDLSRFSKLQYFEYSLYNDAHEQSLNASEIYRLLKLLPNSIKEACIYST
jgi:hypothetical protein